MRVSIPALFLLLAASTAQAAPIPFNTVAIDAWQDLDFIDGAGSVQFPVWGATDSTVIQGEAYGFYVDSSITVNPGELAFQHAGSRVSPGTTAVRSVFQGLATVTFTVPSVGDPTTAALFMLSAGEFDTDDWGVNVTEFRINAWSEMLGGTFLLPSVNYALNVMTGGAGGVPENQGVLLTLLPGDTITADISWQPGDTAWNSGVADGYFTHDFTFSITSLPEPSATVLIAFAIFALAIVARGRS